MYLDFKGRFIICGAKINGIFFIFYFILDGVLEFCFLFGVNLIIRLYVVFVSKVFLINLVKFKKVGFVLVKFNELVLFVYLDCR